MAKPGERRSNVGFIFLLIVIAFALAVVGDVGGIGTRVGELIVHRESPATAPGAAGSDHNSPGAPLDSPDAGPAEAPMTEAWFVDAAGYEGAEAERRGANAAMLIYFARRPCDECHKFEQALLNTPQVKSAIAKMLRVRIDIGNTEKENNLAVKMDVLAAPALVVVAPDGSHRQLPLKTARGAYILPGDLVAELK